MTRQELLEELERLVDRSKNEKDYLEYCLTDDFEGLVEVYTYELKETN